MPNIVFMAAALVAAALPAARAQSCETRTPAARALVEQLRAVVHASDTSATNVRAALGVTPGEASDVEPVTDEAFCRRATVAYYRDRLGPTPTSIVLVRAGTVYAALGRTRCGDMRAILVMYTARLEPLSYICQ